MRGALERGTMKKRHPLNTQSRRALRLLRVTPGILFQQLPDASTLCSWTAAGRALWAQAGSNALGWRNL